MMAALLEMHLSDDSLTLATDLGEVTSGSSATAVNVKLVNVGDAATPELKAFVLGSTHVRYILGGTLITATDADTAISLGVLAPGAVLTGVIDGTGPADALESGLLRIIGG